MIRPAKTALFSKRAVAHCQGKSRYPTKKAAQTHRNRLLRKHHPRHVPFQLRSYCCPICDGWHLTKRVDAPKAVNPRDDLIRRLYHRLAVRQRLEVRSARHFVEWHDGVPA